MTLAVRFLHVLGCAVVVVCGKAGLTGAHERCALSQG